MKGNKKQTPIKGNKTILQTLEEMRKQSDDQARMNDYLAFPVTQREKVQYEPPSWERPLTTSIVKNTK